MEKLFSDQSPGKREGLNTGEGGNGNHRRRWKDSEVVVVSEAAEGGRTDGQSETFPGSLFALLLLGEFQRVAEDLESLLFRAESTCLGRLTVDNEHLPKKPRRERQHRCSHWSHDSQGDGNSLNLEP